MTDRLGLCARCVQQTTEMKAESSKDGKCLKSLVVCAVRYEPVSKGKIGDNREKYREKRKYLHKISDENCKNPTSVGVSWQKRPKQ
jgi:hypothetical protein